MAERKIIQIAVSDYGTTCLTDDGRVWYWTTETEWEGAECRTRSIWKELCGVFVEDSSFERAASAPSEHGRDGE